MKKRLDELHLVTTDTGSLPIEDDFSGNKTNVDQAILDKVSMGLDYPCYPQLLGSHSSPMNMGLQFLIPLSKVEPRIRIKGGEAELLSDDIEPPIEPVGIEQAEYFMDFLRNRGLTSDVKGLKACVTGPFTVASYLNRRSLMTCGASKSEVVKALAEVLSRSCKRLSELGFDLISVDEPFLSVMLGRKVLFNYDEGFIIQTLDTVIADISGPSAIHICGTVTPLVKKVLLESQVDIVDHEFTGSPGNVRAYTRDDLENSGKFVAYGCVSSVKPQVETVGEISASLRNAMRVFGPRIMVKPDCGFGGLSGIPSAYELVLKKLKNMVQAARIVAVKGETADQRKLQSSRRLNLDDSSTDQICLHEEFVEDQKDQKDQVESQEE